MSAAAALLQVDDVGVHAGPLALLQGISFTLHPGEALCLVGESGAGKSLLAQAVMGQLPPALRASGSVAIAGRASRAEDGPARRPLWGRTLALLPQEPAQALSPLMPIAPQLAEVHALVRGEAPDRARAAARAQLQAAGLGAAARQHAWQLSGGMAQRAAAAIALAGGARILLADEPTKGLDAAWRRHAIDGLQALLREGGCAVVITHDLDLARQLGGAIMVLQGGRAVEMGRAREVLAAPRHAFTRRLIDADPSAWPRRGPPPLGETVLQATGLGKAFAGRQLFQGVDLELRQGERAVIRGDSGSGKSTLGNVLLGLVRADAGCVRRAPSLAPTTLQKLYQDPAGAFAPQVDLGTTLRDVARLHAQPWAALEQRLQRLGLDPALLLRRPGEVSGGELQRIALARALLARPALLFADEPTSRLDPLTQRHTLALLTETMENAGACLLLVTHDDALARAVGTRTLRLQGGVLALDQEKETEKAAHAPG
ncbi:ATP-binding cassette domain-containing protein [Paracidovorax citrulli]|uniref:ABC transporter-related protein n=2 Tax=Paracidovorax citrulli TaxID=80869 RepID=A1TUA7_PARC0|nr:ATP-binding cassette domain-containing protein [Paracidovorax citrulli]ABM34545.1 ABC transporter-related protein [Paracidovorax citrulli AAC00-1]ATG93998.1 ABC transporter ATP-binding protein [Paracidovorax citrulli]PVY63984.1 peptide/nickel transport system ATP-binding protein [Paracidovorax citrulli]REG67054.1 peptide/nickel transport system ATP-binding protein [Paracidovorax citrulli]RLJ91614.1 peptide/nickel transport system ATP-binding protein [Paracidovorax citrulli]